jgi:hypothetical protein
MIWTYMDRNAVPSPLPGRVRHSRNDLDTPEFVLDLSEKRNRIISPNVVLAIAKEKKRNRTEDEPVCLDAYVFFYAINLEVGMVVDAVVVDEVVRAEIVDGEPLRKVVKTAKLYSEGMSERTKSRRYAELDKAIAPFVGMFFFFFFFFFLVLIFRG